MEVAQIVEKVGNEVFYSTPFRAIDEMIVVEDAELVPEAPILYFYMIEERNQRKVHNFQFATLSELVLYFRTLNTERGQKLYRYFFEIFLEKYDLIRDKQKEKQRLTEEEKEFVRRCGKQIYSSLQAVGSFFVGGGGKPYRLPIFV